MADILTLKLRNRSKKDAIKRLPATIELPADATVEDAKVTIARQAKVSDFNRIGLFDPVTNKTLKDRRALLRDIETVASAGELPVKDLGPQLAWRTVFVIEYLGPIIFHAVAVAARPYLYPGAESSSASLTQIQWVCFYLFQIHFWKRELETIFVHRFSANTMPAWNVFRNSFFYWAFAGALSAYVIYAPPSYSLFGLVPLGNVVRPELGPLDYLGLAIFAYGEVCNGIVHLHLASLRKPGSAEKGIPNCIGSGLVTCPNYMFEVTAWVGVILVSRAWAVVVFIFFGTLYMRMWARDKERALRQTFGDKYKKKRYTMLPGLF